MSLVIYNQWCKQDHDLEESSFCGGPNSLLVQLPWSGTSSRQQHVDISTRRQSEPAQAANDSVTPSLTGLPQQQQPQYEDSSQNLTRPTQRLRLMNVV